MRRRANYFWSKIQQLTLCASYSYLASSCFRTVWRAFSLRILLFERDCYLDPPKQIKVLRLGISHGLTRIQLAKNREIIQAHKEERQNQKMCIHKQPGRHGSTTAFPMFLHLVIIIQLLDQRQRSTPSVFPSHNKIIFLFHLSKNKERNNLHQHLIK